MQFSLFPSYSSPFSSNFTNSMLYASTYALAYSFSSFLLTRNKLNQYARLRDRFAIRFLYSFPIAYLSTLIASNSKEVLCMCYGALVLTYSSFLERRISYSISTSIIDEDSNEESDEESDEKSDKNIKVDAHTNAIAEAIVEANADLKKNS
jgi:hypothetical protein